MLTSALISILEKTDTPRGVSAVAWALEKATGFSTTSVVEWYQRNGYHRIGGLGGYPTYTGKSVSRDSALEISAFYAGVKVISEDMGAMPFHAYERSRDRKIVDKAYGHPLYRVLHDLANPETSAGEMVEALTAHALLTGDGYAGITRAGGNVQFLWPWQPEEVRTDRNSAGVLFYLRKEGNLAEKTYARDQVFHLRGFTLDGIHGESLVRRARQVLGISQATEEYAAKFFANDATPGVVISFPQTTPKVGPESVQAIKEAWIKWHRGNPHEPAVLQGGATATRVANNNQDSQLLESRNHQVIEACRLLRLSPHKLADLSRATFANIEHLAIEHVTNTLGPWIDRWRRSVYRCLLTTDEQLAGRIWAEHDVAGLLRGDFQTQSEGFRKLLEKGVYSINEVRRWLNLNPIPGGDEHFVQLNMGTVQEIAAGMNLSSTLVPVKSTPEIQRALAEVKARLALPAPSPNQ